MSKKISSTLHKQRFFTCHESLMDKIKILGENFSFYAAAIQKFPYDLFMELLLMSLARYYEVVAVEGLRSICINQFFNAVSDKMNLILEY